MYWAAARLNESTSCLAGGRELYRVKGLGIFTGTGV